MDKICPLKEREYCVKERCAWWMEDRAGDEKYSSCAITKIATELMIMEAQV